MSNQEKANILEMIDERFGELVELLKQKRGYTLQELSDKTNLSPSYIYRLMRGYRGCELTTKLNILLNGFGMQEEAEQYLKTVIENKETLRKILD
ncbi:MULTISPECIES: helix-turn-helix domain-containing protein [Bacillaceae]|uniref:Helix-turn-helix domain-containing protein n=1 Tax=Gracilibacillus salinarum TaxID=2932255 RepID=A0ABY4GKA7_9BACI|nr:MULTISPECIES: helix-turn-helix transcriptional regulator [Bacillaceae]MCA1025024.1 helix-turn-helix domain-containing protein [Cytobacillus kochii]UOQ84634.1 helix-turn-helix domain-containing protein [Gracilibacillus salinarum]